MIAALVTFVGYLIITNVDTYSDVLYSPIGPCIVFFLVGYIVGVLFMSVWSMACDTIL